MSLETILVQLATIVAEEAARNPEFRARLERALDREFVPSETTPKQASEGDSVALEEAETPPPKPEPTGTPLPPTRRSHALASSDGKRRGGRRTPAVLDPIALAAEGEPALRGRLEGLDLERLLDIVAQFGMDPGKLVMKWRDPERVIDRIVELSLARATKGDAFRKE